MAGDIAGAGYECIVRYKLANTRWELLNPATGVVPDGSISTAKIADSAVTTAKINDAAVTTAKINDDAVTLAKMASGTAGNLIPYDASGDPAAVATGTSGQVLTSNGAGAKPTFQDLPESGITEVAAQATTSGVAWGFTGIPSTAKRITVKGASFSTSGASAPIIQIGDGSYVTTGYLGSGQTINTTATQTTGFCIAGSWASTIVAHFTATLERMEEGSNEWVFSCRGGRSDGGGGGGIIGGGGSVTLSGTLDRLRLTTVGGTDTGDSGSVSISYE